MVDNIKSLFNYIFKFDKLQFEVGKVIDEEALIKEKLLLKDGDLLNLNLDSDSTFESLVVYAENILKTKFPDDISESLSFYDQFYEEIKLLNKAPFANSYNILFDNFGAYILRRRSNDGKEITEFMLTLTVERKDRDKNLYGYEKHYYNAVLKLLISKELISKAIKHSIKDETPRYYANSYCRKLAFQNVSFANELVEFWSQDQFDKNFKNLQGIILTNLYKQDCKTFENSFFILQSHPKNFIDFLASLDYQNEENLQKALTFVEKIEQTENDCGSEIIQFYSKLLEIKGDSEEIGKTVFKKFYHYFEKEDEDIRGWIIHILTRNITGFESERYQFLHYILSKTKNINVIKYYFENFKDLVYFFHFFETTYEKLEFRTNLTLFEHAIRKFWRNNQSETESHILKFLANENISKRIAGIHLILMGVFKVNILKISSEIGQLRSLEAFERFPHSIETLVNFILQFRKSKYTSVKEEFKRTVAKLIFDAYHEHLYNIVTDLLSSSAADKKLKNYFTEVLDSYKEMREFKGKINDLSANQNEYNLMDLYYRLEHENKAKMMEEAKEGKGTFLEHMGKTTVIVRGNAWKLDGQDEIRKLESIEHSVIVDGRIYKNPDLYEYTLNSNISKYDKK